MSIIYCTMFLLLIVYSYIICFFRYRIFRPSDTSCQSTLQCVQRKFPVAVSAVQQFKILGIRAAKPPVLVHHISDAGFAFFMRFPFRFQTGSWNCFL